MAPPSAKPLAEAWRPPRGRVLVLAPHPDDETLGCGGALLLHRRRGDRVKVVIATDGAAGDPLGRCRGRDYRALRRAEARRAAAVLGVAALEFWDYPDGRLSEAAGLSRRLRDLLESERPDVVYRPSRQDPHRDHAALARGFERSRRGSPTSLVDCAYEVCYLQKPSVVVDITEVFARKLEALRKYRSQLLYSDYVGLSARAGLCRGLFLPGARYAEAFRISA